MAAVRPGRAKAPTLLVRYGAQFAQLLEQKLAEDALSAAQAEAQLNADHARLAIGEAKFVGEQLRKEQHRLSLAQSRLDYIANHDELTGLPNRSYFSERLEQAVHQASETSKTIALFYIDLDHFKQVNDSLGHETGDRLLQETAQRLQNSVRSEHFVARLGGNEFAVFASDLLILEDAQRLAEQLVVAFSEPFYISDHRIIAPVSIGVTIYPQDSSDAKLLQRNANVALSLCKQENRNGFQFFDLALDEAVQRRSLLERALRAALQNGEMSLAYQPQVFLSNGRIEGVEALLRWNSKEYGTVSPDVFIPIAERCGLIAELGAWVLQESCYQAIRWDEAGIPGLTISVNVSVPQLRMDSLPLLVASVLRETALHPSRLILEITETEIMRDMQTSIDTLMRLREMGIKLAIDDFGTGYSSLNYLRRLTVDKIKIDKSFVTDVTQNVDAATIASTIVTLARNLRLSVIAEGVETIEQEDFLRNIGCQYGQGYLYGKPSPSHEFIKRFAPQPSAELCLEIVS